MKSFVIVSIISQYNLNRVLSKMITFKTTDPKKYFSTIYYGFHSTSFGKCLLGLASEGICHLSFVDNEDSSLEELKKDWPKAQFKQDDQNTDTFIQHIFSKDGKNKESEFSLFIKGTDFQVKVWKALITIPEGETTSYENVANLIGSPNAVRAVANAIAGNPIAYLVPCHRVISKSGAINKYRWGVERKKDILAYER